MPLRRDPTLRQRRLGAELRRMREQAGMGGSQLARTLGLNPTQVTQMEAGKIGVSAERLRTVATACKCANEPLIDALAVMATEREKGWWEEYRGVLPADFLDVAEIEGHATGITVFNMTFIPGLLQTSSYTASVFTKGFPPLPQQDVDQRTTFRLRRQQLIRSGGTPFVAFIHEAALRIQYGQYGVLHEQLGGLLEDSELPGFSIRIVPFDTEDFPGPSENLFYAEGPVPELDTVQADSSLSSHLFDSPAHLASYREILARIESVALSEYQSRDFIRSIMKEAKVKHE
ncbi:helix-turn-helix domain-containing protein [Kitasatospora viridis]|uniref:Helix-turn-helix protein n=1 Tax=Kitasatospora viridis TaxID=281105 RepID=A0A561UC91_9ACTN|nr:helix-turn-helix transcriptional regulator [Kitasatospora viridis]TWF96973.1 helix-turn-helix protein [Kitasatospora viridis]